MKIRSIARKNLVKLRTKAVLTQSELAEKADLSLTMIQKLENGKSWGSDETFDAMSKALKCPVVDFFKEEPTPTTKALLELIETLAKRSEDLDLQLRLFSELHEVFRSLSKPQLQSLLGLVRQFPSAEDLVEILRRRK